MKNMEYVGLDLPARNDMVWRNIIDPNVVFRIDMFEVVLVDKSVQVCSLVYCTQVFALPRQICPRQMNFCAIPNDIFVNGPSVELPSKGSTDVCYGFERRFSLLCSVVCLFSRRDW